MSNFPEKIKKVPGNPDECESNICKGCNDLPKCRENLLASLAKVNMTEIREQAVENSLGSLVFDESDP